MGDEDETRNVVDQLRARGCMHQDNSTRLHRDEEPGEEEKTVVDERVALAEAVGVGALIQAPG
jgi:hypothetical protein